MFLLRLHRLAHFLHPVRKYCLLAAFCGLAFGLYAAFTGHDLDSWSLRLSLVFALWALMLFCCIQLFGRIPPPVLPGLGFFERLRDRLRLLLYQALALFVLILSIVLLQMSLKLLTV